MKSYHLLYFTIFLTLILSCSKKEVQLPLIELDGLTEVTNHSSIWLFFEENGKDTLAVLNKNNKIINTNWILNIDKRLTMKSVAPYLIEMQFQKIKPSMHKKEGTYLYFSFANLKSNNFYLIEFKPTNIIQTSDQLKKHNHQEQLIEIDIQKENIFINNIKTEWDQLEQKLRDHKKKDSLNNFKIFLKYNENISYQEYLNTKTVLSKINIAIDSTEYIYSLK